eukprot:PITA_24575
MDEKTTFLNGDLKENVFMSQSEGFVEKGQEQKVCKLIKSVLQPSLHSNGTEFEAYIERGNEFEDAMKYKQLIGSLIYLTTTRPNISYVVGILFRFMQKPCEGHCSTTKRVLRYLKGTQDYGLKYTKVDDFNLMAHSDPDFVEDRKNGVSTSGYLMSLGFAVVSWRSCKQPVLTDSTIEAEYVAAAEAIKEIVWLRKYLKACWRNK